MSSQPKPAKKQIYPKPEKPRKNKSGRRYKIHYYLVYDGGGGEWDGYYRTYLGARIAAWYNEYIGSWGGSATLIDQRNYVKSKKDQD